MANRGVIGRFAVLLVLLGGCPDPVRAGDAVKLLNWAPEGLIVRGSGLGQDLFHLVVEAEWDPSASRSPDRYQVRVAFPDGRVDLRPFPVESPPGRRRFPVYVLASPIRDTFPSAVQVAVTIVDASTGAPVGNTLTAGIEQFPRPKGDASGNDPGPFGVGKPLGGPVRILPNPGPDGLRFARIVGSEGKAGFFVATTEATVGQLSARIKGYDPKAGRSDEFALEDPSQPAINLTPAKALDYLKSLSSNDPSGITYRFPTADEWTRAAKGEKTSNYWWGIEPSFPGGANLLGPEPAQPGDSTAPSSPPSASPTFQANPFGLAHTFGNAAEWATRPTGGFARMGGHFRSEPAGELPEVAVEAPDATGPDPFVGVRPAFSLSPEEASTLIRKKLASDPRFARVDATYDPDQALARLTGPVSDATARRAADSVLEGLWFVASVDNQLTTPSLIPNQLAILGSQAGPSKRSGVLDRTFVEVPLTIRWLDPLPVIGSSYWVNIYLPGGGHSAYKLEPGEPGRSTKLVVRIDRSRLAALGLPDDSPIKVALSLGSASSTPFEPRVVSNLADVRPNLPPRTR